MQHPILHPGRFTDSAYSPLRVTVECKEGIVPLMLLDGYHVDPQRAQPPTPARFA